MERYILYTLYYDWRASVWKKKPILYTSDSKAKLARIKKNLEEEHICDIIDTQEGNAKVV